MKYRPDVDGLRAIAVALVVFFHFGFPLSGSGFIGVDIFFVLSGFLIAGTYFTNLSTLSDVGTFFRRRVARILPVATVTYAVILLLTRFISGPIVDREILNSAQASTLFFSNFYFWNHSDYFNALSDLNPFLHTWSLSVEEQFYLLVPFLLLPFRSKHRLFIVLGIISFVLNAIYTPERSTFFLLPFRLWELSVGAIIATTDLRKLATHSRLFAACGLFLLIFATVIAGLETTPAFFGHIVPVLATGMLLIAGSGTNAVNGKWLGNRWLALLGKTSYTVYLIHWPIFVFAARYWDMEALATTGILHPGVHTILQSTELLFGTAALTVFSYNLIEKPSRRFLRDLPALALMACAIAMLAIPLSIIAFDQWVIHSKAVADQAIKQIEQFKDSKKFWNPDKDCQIQTSQSFEQFHSDCWPKQSKEKKVLVLGDSYAGHLVSGLKQAAGADFVVIQATAAGCSPLGEKYGVRCNNINQFFFDKILMVYKPDLVLISSRWKKSQNSLGDDVFKEKATALLTKLKDNGFQILLVGHSPTSMGGVPDLVENEISRLSEIPHEMYLPQDSYPELNAELAEIAAKENVTFINPAQSLCHGRKCLVAIDGDPLYWDEGHMSGLGSEIVVRSLIETIKQKLGIK